MNGDGAQARTTPIQSDQSLTQKWDNQSSISALLPKADMYSAETDVG
jgi:hypothetical protein